MISRPQSIRLTLVAVVLIVLGALLLWDRAAYRCLEAGGHFEALRWTCRPHPPIILQRELKRT